MNFATQKLVVNVIAAPNPTQYTKSAEYNVKNKKMRLVRNCSGIGFRVLFAMSMLPIPTISTLGAGLPGTASWSS